VRDGASCHHNRRAHPNWGGGDRRWSLERGARSDGRDPAPHPAAQGHSGGDCPVPEDVLRCKVVLSAGYMDSIKAGGGGAAVAANIQQVKNGNLLLGSSRQFSGFDMRVDPAVAGEIIRRCLRFYRA
jgi:hypothetical protein